MPLTASLPVETENEIVDIARVQARRAARSPWRRSATRCRCCAVRPMRHRCAGTKVNGDAVDVIDVTEAVRPCDRHAVVAGDARNLVLQRRAVGPASAKPAAKMTTPPTPRSAQPVTASSIAGARNRQHGAIDALPAGRRAWISRTAAR